MAAALIITTTACSNEDYFADEPTPATTKASKTYTMTVTAAMPADDATRALSVDGKKLNATWEIGDVIKVMKRREMLGNVIYSLLGTLSAATVNTEGLTATFTGSFTDANVLAAGGIAVGDLLLFGYPGTNLGSSTGSFVFNYNGQDGTLGNIAVILTTA